MKCPRCHSEQSLSLSKLYETRKLKDLTNYFFDKDHPLDWEWQNDDSIDASSLKDKLHGRRRHFKNYYKDFKLYVSPPPEKISKIIFPLMILAIVNFMTGNHWIWSIILLLIAGYFAYQDHLYRVYVSPRKFEEWRKSVICLECGAIYLPDDAKIVNAKVDFEQLILEKHSQFIKNVGRLFYYPYWQFRRLWIFLRLQLSKLIKIIKRSGILEKIANKIKKKDKYPKNTISYSAPKDDNEST